MKHFRRIFLVTTFAVIYTCIAYFNYNRAMWKALGSCGSDACIEEAIRPYGFDHDVFEPITTVDILVAPIISVTR